jgi:hypothetical protein
LRFTILQLAHWHASSCRHDPSGRDVLGCVDICVLPMTATATLEHRLALAVFSCAISTGRASLGGVGSTDPLDPSTRLVLESTDQKPPPARKHSPIQLCLAFCVARRRLAGTSGSSRHVANVQIFNPDDVETSRKLRTELLYPILSAINLSCLEPGEDTQRLRPALRSTTSPRKSALESDESLSLRHTHRGAAKMLTCRQSRRVDHPTIQSHHRSISWSLHLLRDSSEGDMPSARGIQRHPIRLCRRHASAPPKPDPSGFGNEHQAIALADSPHLALSYGDDPEPFVTALLSPTWSTTSAGDVSKHASGKVIERLLLDGARSRREPVELLPGFSQLPTLLGKPRGPQPISAPVGVLLDSQVPDESCMRAVLHQRLLLRRRRIKAKFRHAVTLPHTTDSFLNGAKCQPTKLRP